MCTLEAHGMVTTIKAYNTWIQCLHITLPSGHVIIDSNTMDSSITECNTWLHDTLTRVLRHG